MRIVPIEIRELVIRATVEPGESRASDAAPAQPRRDELVAECVEQVLDVLRRQRER